MFAKLPKNYALQSKSGNKIPVFAIIMNLTIISVFIFQFVGFIMQFKKGNLPK